MQYTWRIAHQKLNPMATGNLHLWILLSRYYNCLLHMMMFQSLYIKIKSNK